MRGTTIFQGMSVYNMVVLMGEIVGGQHKSAAFLVVGGVGMSGNKVRASCIEKGCGVK